MKYQFDILLEQLKANRKPIFEDASPLITAALDKVIIDASELAKNKDDIVKAKGGAWYAQLEGLAKEKAILTVSAIKRVNKHTANAVDVGSRTFQEEVDVVGEYNPGSYHSPMSVPITILKKITDYNGGFNIPLKDKYRYHQNTESEVRDEYNSGKQPKGTKEATK